VRYLAYGLTIESDVRLPELPQPDTIDRARVDITVRLSDPPGVLPRVLDVVQARTGDGGAPWLSIARTGSGYVISEAGIADFVVDRHGTEIVLCRVGTRVSELTLRHVLLDWVLALVLNLRGKQVLHASAVVTPHGLCAFVGPTTSGKSTLAASFSAAGYAVLCDDCLVVERNDRGGFFECTPAYPGLRLWEDSVEGMGLGKYVTQAVAGYMPKLRVVVGDGPNGPAAGSHRLARIYGLNRVAGETNSQMPRIEALDGKSALIQLVGSSWLCDPTDKVALVGHFRFFEALTKAIPVRKLHLPNGMALLPKARDAVLADLAGEGRDTSGLWDQTVRSQA
jgi:hypothetical protein